MNATSFARAAVTVAVISLFAGCSTWNNMGRTEKGTAIGAGTGAVAGAAVGGPVGAAVGAGVGGVVGHEAEAPGANRGAGTTTARASSDVDSSLTRSVQQSLNDRGYAVTVDGQWGPATENALRQFQRSNGIAETGRLDDRTMAALGVSRTSGAMPSRANTTGTAPR